MGGEHHGLFLAMFRSQPGHYPSENVFLAPAHPSAVKRFVRAIGGWSIAPTQAIAIDEDNPAQHTSIINPRLAVGLREERLKARHLRVRQPEKIRSGHRSFSSRGSCR